MCSLCVPLSVVLAPALRQGVVHVFVVCAPVCWSYAFKLTSGGVFNYVHALLLPYSPVIRHLCLYLHRKEMGA